MEHRGSTINLCLVVLNNDYHLQGRVTHKIQENTIEKLNLLWSGLGPNNYFPDYCLLKSILSTGINTVYKVVRP